MDGVADIAKAIKLGDGLDPDTQMGPLVSDEQLERVSGYLDSGRAGGRDGRDRRRAAQATGATSSSPPSSPTTRPDMQVVREEIFGPVVVASSRSRAWTRSPPRPTTPSTASAPAIWTRDIAKAHALAKRIRAGTVWINCYNVFDAALPFGGYKQSGWGREMGHEALEAYTEVKAVCTQL